MEAFIGLALAEDVEVAAGAELGEEARPARRIERSIKSGQKRMIHHLQYLSLNLCPRVFVPGHEFLLVHHLRREEAPAGALELHQVDASDVATPHALHEPEVAECQGGAAAALYGVPGGVRGGCVGLGGERPLRAGGGGCGGVVGVFLGGGVHCVVSDNNNNNGVGVCCVGC